MVQSLKWGAWLRYVLSSCAIATVASVAMGQSAGSALGTSGDNVQGTGEALRVGPFLFSPALELTWESRDNITFAPDDEIADKVYLARARLLLELPIYDSYVRVAYQPQYREYQTYQFGEPWAHFLDVGGEFNFASGLRLTTAYRYITGNLETREVDPGGELIPGESQFDKNYAQVIADYWLTYRDGVRIEASLSTVSFNQRDEAFFYPYSQSDLALGWVHQVNPTVVMDLMYRRNEFNADLEEDFRDSSADELTLGLRGQLTAVLSSELRVGWRRTSYGDGPDGAPVPDFSGFVVRGGVSWQTGHGGLVRLDLLRSDYPSAYRDNSYYTSSGVSLLYNIRRGRLFGQGRMRFQQNDYHEVDPVFGSERSDEIITYGVGLGLRLTEFLSVRGSYLYEERDTFYPLSYETNIFVLGLAAGF